MDLQSILWRPFAPVQAQDDMADCYGFVLSSNGPPQLLAHNYGLGRFCVTSLPPSCCTPRVQEAFVWCQKLRRAFGCGWHAAASVTTRSLGAERGSISVCRTVYFFMPLIVKVAKLFTRMRGLRSLSSNPLQGRFFENERVKRMRKGGELTDGAAMDSAASTCEPVVCTSLRQQRAVAVDEEHRICIEVRVEPVPQQDSILFLYENFAPFGAVHGVRVLSGDGIRPSAGLIYYLAATDAEAAVRCLNGAVVCGNPLHVTLTSTTWQ